MSALVAFATSYAVVIPIGWLSGWEYTAPILAVQLTIAGLVIVAAEALRSRSWEYYQQGRQEYIDRIAAERLLAMIIGEKETTHSYALDATQLRTASPQALATKRFLDIVLAGTGLFLLAPLLLMIGVLIKLDSAGPALFASRRIGQGGREFNIFKFRTMVAGPALHRQLLVEALFDENIETRDVIKDLRVTRVGRWLRTTALDELPQLWNVLRSDMSLVGPRPLLAAADGYELLRQHPELTQVLVTKPGLTGTIPINRRRELRDLLEILELERSYLLRWSFWGDVRILVRTVREALTTITHT